MTDKPVRVESVGTGIEVRDVWTGRVAENFQDLEASEGQVVCVWGGLTAFAALILNHLDLAAVLLS